MFWKVTSSPQWCTDPNLLRSLCSNRGKPIPCDWLGWSLSFGSSLSRLPGLGTVYRIYRKYVIATFVTGWIGKLDHMKRRTIPAIEEGILPPCHCRQRIESAWGGDIELKKLWLLS